MNRLTASLIFVVALASVQASAEGPVPDIVFQGTYRMGSLTGGWRGDFSPEKPFDIPDLGLNRFATIAMIVENNEELIGGDLLFTGRAMQEGELLMGSPQSIRAQITVLEIYARHDQPYEITVSSDTTLSVIDNIGTASFNNGVGFSQSQQGHGTFTEVDVSTITVMGTSGDYEFPEYPDINYGRLIQLNFVSAISRYNRGTGTVTADGRATFSLRPLGDSDEDGVLDNADNCTLTTNPDQRDTNGDAIGNACDPDLNDDCTVNVEDLGMLRKRFFEAYPDADFNGDGVVNVGDLGIMKARFFMPPGPSATECEI